jgi:Putative peptidoglycan binding domain
MKLHFLLASVVAIGLQVSAPDTMAHGGGGGGSGGGGHGGGGGGRGGNFHGGWHGGGFHGGGFHGHGRFFHGRFFGPGVGFYGYGYPWWGGDYGYYPYYGYGYDDAYYSGPNEGDRDAGFNSPRAVQAALAWRGYYSGRIDGVMGPETRAAIRSFQSHQGLPVTGQIDSRLINSLRR